MYKSFLLKNNMQVRFRYQGLGAGLNYSTVHAPLVAKENIDRLRRIDGASNSTLIMAQINNDINICPAADLDSSIPGAALITNIPYHVLLLRPADCIPIIVFGDDPKVLALIHAGRRELDVDIISKTIVMLCNTYNVKPSALKAYVGPGIKQKSYILPAEIIATLTHTSWKPFLQVTSGNQVMIDMFGFARTELRHAGLSTKAISQSTIDTAEHADYFSHYRQVRGRKTPGANACSVVLTTKI